MPRTFVYGTFWWVSMLVRPMPRLPSSRIPPPPRPPLDLDGLMAVEILREFGAPEFVGRLEGRRRGGTWSPIQPSSVQLFPWYEAFKKNPALVVFDLEV